MVLLELKEGMITDNWGPSERVTFLLFPVNLPCQAGIIRLDQSRVHRVMKVTPTHLREEGGLLNNPHPR